MSVSKPPESALKIALKQCRPLFWGAFWFGLFINLLMLAVPIYSLQVLDRVLSSGSVDTLIMLTVVVVVSIILMGLLQGLRSIVFHHIGRWLDDRLSTDVVQKTVALAIHRPKVGSQPLRDLTSVRSFVTSPALAGLFDAPWAVIFFAVIYMIHIHLGMLVTGAAVVLLVLAIIAERVPSKQTQAANDRQVKSMQAFDSLVRNAEVIKSMGLLDRAAQRWREHNAAGLEHTFSASNTGAVIQHTIRSLRLGVQVMVIGFGGWLVLQNQITPGAMIAVSILTGRALAPFDAAVSIYQSFVNVRQAASRLSELDVMGNGINEAMMLPEPQGTLSLNNASYREPVSGRWLLRDVSINLEAGEALGVIGPSGAGKTTLARMMVGVIEPTSGSIALDGAALIQWNERQLGDVIGYLPQSVELFDGAIADNIARLDTEANDEAIIKAAQSAMVHDAILSFPRGYKTDIGPNGSSLSTGQRQRIGLARCFFGAPKMIVLDEPTANLDTEGEAAFVQALSNAKERGITTITIAHRPSVLQNVDKLVVLQNGEVKLFGPASEVLAKLANANKNVEPLRKISPSSD